MDVFDKLDPEAYQGLKQRTLNVTDSVLRTHKSHFEAADTYDKIDTIVNVLVAFFATVVTGSLIWSAVPEIVPILLSLVTAGLSGIKTAFNPGHKARLNNRAGESYLRLFDDFRDFIEIEMLPEEEMTDDLYHRYIELQERRQDLNNQYPSLHRYWYDRLDEEKIYDEIETTEEAHERLVESLK